MREMKCSSKIAQVWREGGWLKRRERKEFTSESRAATSAPRGGHVGPTGAEGSLARGAHGLPHGLAKWPHVIHTPLARSLGSLPHILRRFEDSSEDSSSIEESENTSSSEDSEISSNDEEFEASSNQDYISFNDKILQQKNEENNKLKLINANLVVIFKALVNEKKMSLEKMSKQSEVINEHEKTIEKYVSKMEESAQELDDLKEDFTMKLFAMKGEIKQKENSLSIMKIKECELIDEVKALKESNNGMKIGALSLMK
ncbi:hypothetical protein LWI29_008167 [Acer saccharum]|uniref:Uncharacterized protein n=1 Tax=Acer saccharum TaxID=4024 RepID=A0AA39S3U0_ACESA|nr:hypothetical protein LWI29_008167 [Acer saccharum]